MKTCLIDDDQLFLFGMKRILEVTKVASQISQFENGYEAIKYFENSRANEELLPDVIFVDINMPVMDGWEFIEKFSKLKSAIRKDITIYMVSSSIDYNDAERARSIRDITEYMIKPITIDQVKELYYKPSAN